LPKTEFARREQISPDVLGWWQAEIQKRDGAKRRPDLNPVREPDRIVIAQVLAPATDNIEGPSF